MTADPAEASAASLAPVEGSTPPLRRWAEGFRAWLWEAPVLAVLVVGAGALAHLGEHGWELIGVYDKSSNWWQGMEKGFALFKRSVADGEEPDGGWCVVDDRNAHHHDSRKLADAILALDANDRILFGNPKAAALFGEYRDQTLSALVVPGDRERVIDVQLARQMD